MFIAVLAGDGLYREARHFTAWVKERQVEAYKLHQVVRDITGQNTVPIGDFILETPDTSVTCETCEELVGTSFILFGVQPRQAVGWGRSPTSG